MGLITPRSVVQIYPPLPIIYQPSSEEIIKSYDLSGILERIPSAVNKNRFNIKGSAEKIELE